MVENVVRLIGYLTHPPERGRTRRGADRAVLRLATRRNWTSADGQENEVTDYHRVVVYGPLIAVAGAARSGDYVGISGRLHSRSWVQNGERRYLTEVVAESVRCLGPEANQAKRPG